MEMRRINLMKANTAVMVSFLLMFSQVLFAQTKRVRTIEELSQAISSNLNNPNWEELDKLCIQSVVFMKFDLNKNGELENITFSKGAPEVVKAMLKTAISSVAVKENSKQLRGHTFLQPFIFIYEVGCSDALEDRMEKDQFHQSLLTMLSFEAPLSKPLSCTILSPLMQSSKR